MDPQQFLYFHSLEYVVLLPLTLVLRIMLVVVVVVVVVVRGSCILNVKGFIDLSLYTPHRSQTHDVIPSPEPSG